MVRVVIPACIIIIRITPASSPVHPVIPAINRRKAVPAPAITAVVVPVTPAQAEAPAVQVPAIPAQAEAPAIPAPAVTVAQAEAIPAPAAVIAVPAEAIPAQADIKDGQAVRTTVVCNPEGLRCWFESSTAYKN